MLTLCSVQRRAESLTLMLKSDRFGLEKDELRGAEVKIHT